LDIFIAFAKTNQINYVLKKFEIICIVIIRLKLSTNNEMRIVSNENIRLKKYFDHFVDYINLMITVIITKWLSEH